MSRQKLVGQLQKPGARPENVELLVYNPNTHFRKTEAESAAGITPTNYQYEPGNVLRYGTNTTPGTTDMTAAIQNALSVAENSGTAASGRRSARIPSGRYKITDTLVIPRNVDLVGEGRWNTRLEFALTTNGAICVDLRGTDVNTTKDSTVRKMRIDGSNCTGSSVIGVQVNWNLFQHPLLDEVTIFGGYEVNGTGTGLANGLVFTEDGSNWNISFNELAIEGCYAIQCVLDTQSGGSQNAIQFNGGRIQNGKTQNLVILGPNDDINTVNITFQDTTFEKGSYGNTGIDSSIQLQGAVLVEMRGCYFEEAAAPNSPTTSIEVVSGRVSFHSCNWAFALICLRVDGGEATLSGHNVFRSSTSGVSISSGTLNVNGELSFLGSGTPIVYTTAAATISWPRSRYRQKTANYTVTTDEIGTTFSNQGSKQNITLTLPTCPHGVTLAFQNGGISLRNSTYRWTASGSGTAEYYVELAAGGDPGLSSPSKFYDFSTSRTKGTAGSLANLEWDYADNDTLGFSTIYYRTNGADPDTNALNTLIATYTLTVTPTTFRILPTGTIGGDSIVSDGALGSFLQLRAMNNEFWLEESKVGSWT